MPTKIDHLGVLVDDIESNTAVFEALGLSVGAIERVTEFEVRITFIAVGENLIELVEPLNPDSDLAAAEGSSVLHHVALRVENIEDTLEQLRKEGIPLADEEPRPGAGEARVAFLEQRAANEVLIELAERTQEISLTS